MTTAHTVSAGVGMQPADTARAPLVGVVLGSGGARGMAHIGVLKRLHELGMRPHCVVGTSAGALVGAAYAAGRLDVLETHVRQLDWRRVAQLFVEVNFSRAGLISGRHIERLLREIYGVSQISQLPIPFAAVATALEEESEAALSEGNLMEAVRASIAIPGIFTPVRREGRVLVDGGLINPLPVSVARRMGAERVLAVDVNLRAGASRSSRPASIRRRSGATLTIFDVLTRTLRIFENQVTRNRIRLEPPDLLLQPAVGEILTLDFQRAPAMIAAGAAAVDEQLPELAAFLPPRTGA